MFRVLKFACAIFFVFYLSAQASPLAFTQSYLEEILSRVVSQIPEAQGYTIRIQVLPSMNEPVGRIVYKFDDDSRGQLAGPATVQLNLSFLLQFQSEQALVAFVAHEVGHLVQERRFRSHAQNSEVTLPSNQRIELEADHVMYEALVSMGIGPEAVRDLFDGLSAYRDARQMFRQPQFMPLGWTPLRTEARGFDFHDLVDTMITATHPSDELRVLMTEFMGVRDDLTERLPTDRQLSPIPARLRDEVLVAYWLKNQNNSSRNSFESRLREIRFLKDPAQVGARFHELFMEVEERIFKGDDDIDERPEDLMGELAYWIAVTSHELEKDPSSLVHLNLLRRLLMLFDRLHFKFLPWLYSGDDVSESWESAYALLTFEGLRAVQIHQELLAPSDEQLVRDYEDWVDWVSQDEGDNSLPRELSFSSLLALLDERVWNQFNPNDLVYLISNLGEEDFEMRGIISGHFSNLLDLASHTLAPVSALYDSEYYRPSLIAINRFSNNFRLSPHFENVRAEVLFDESAVVISREYDREHFLGFALTVDDAREALDERTTIDLSETERWRSGVSGTGQRLFLREIQIDDRRSRADRAVNIRPDIESLRLFSLQSDTGTIDSVLGETRFQTAKPNAWIPLTRAIIHLSDWRASSLRLSYLLPEKKPFEYISTYLISNMGPTELEDDLFWMTTDETASFLERHPRGSREYEQIVEAILERAFVSDFYFEPIDFYLALTWILYKPHIILGDSYDLLLASPHANFLFDIRERLFEELGERDIVSGERSLKRDIEALGERLEEDDLARVDTPDAREGLALHLIERLKIAEFSSSDWKSIASTFRSQFAPYLSEDFIYRAMPVWKENLDQLQRHILEQMLTEESSWNERLEATIVAAGFNRYTQVVQENLARLLADIAGAPEPIQATKDFLQATSKALIPLDLDTVDRLTSDIFAFYSEKVRDAAFHGRAAILEDLVGFLTNELGDNPFYYVVDEKLDRLAEEIQATHVEANLLLSARKVGSDINSFFQNYDSRVVDAENRIIQLMNLIVFTSSKRSVQANVRLRHFILHGEREGVEQFLNNLVDDLYDEFKRQPSLVREVFPASAEKISQNLQKDNLFANRKAVKTAILNELQLLPSRFSRIPPKAQLVLASLLLTTQSNDGIPISDENFLQQASARFFLEEENANSSSLILLGEEFLRAFDEPSRALLLSQAEIQDSRIIVAESEIERIRARRTVQLLQGLGPMGIKIGQLLARSPNMAPVFREELSKLEDQAAKPPYAELYSLLAPHLSAEEKLQVPRILMVKAGSIKITLIVEFSDAEGGKTKKVFSIRRPHLGRLVERVFERMKTALVAASAREGGEVFLPYVNLPDEALELVLREMDFENEFNRMLNARQIYESRSSAGTVTSVSPERLSYIDENHQAIVMPFIPGRRLDEIEDEVMKRRALAELLEVEFRILMSRENLSLDIDRHLGNFLIVPNSSQALGFEIVHYDFGQWVDMPVAHRDFFGQLVARLKADFESGQDRFVHTLHLFEKLAGRSLSRTNWWRNLKDQFALIRESGGDRVELEPSFHKVMQALLYIREAVEKSDKDLASSIFRLTKGFETLGGVAESLGGRDVFEASLANVMAEQLQPEHLEVLAGDPGLDASLQIFFPDLPSIELCTQSIKRALKKL